jgi:hypothetical protein
VTSSVGSLEKMRKTERKTQRHSSSVGLHLAPLAPRSPAPRCRSRRRTSPPACRPGGPRRRQRRRTWTWTGAAGRPRAADAGQKTDGGGGGGGVARPRCPDAEGRRAWEWTGRYRRPRRPRTTKGARNPRRPGPRKRSARRTRNPAAGGMLRFWRKGEKAGLVYRSSAQRKRACSTSAPGRHGTTKRPHIGHIPYLRPKNISLGCWPV